MSIVRVHGCLLSICCVTFSAAAVAEQERRIEEIVVTAEQRESTVLVRQMKPRTGSKRQRFFIRGTTG
jgi:hypothetical protein